METQGLLKSALVCALAKKIPDPVVAGLANATEFSGYEPLARNFYTQQVQVPLQCHAVDRSRYVVSSAFDWPLIKQTESTVFYPEQASLPVISQQVGFQNPYVLFFHSTARDAKRWSEVNWIHLGNALAVQGYQVVLPWGNSSEKSISEKLAVSIPNSLVPNAFSIEEAFSIISNAALVVGVDTGLTHLSAALNRSTVEIYCDSPKWKTEGYWSAKIRNLGDIQSPPSAQEVIDASEELLGIKN
jgi:heptosyltransferase I